MSVLTEVILTCAEPEWVDETRIDLPIRWINASLKEQYGELVKLNDEKAGGKKVFCHQIWVACFNHLNRDEFLALIKSAPWSNPQNVTVTWCRENPYDDGFVVAFQGSEVDW